MLTTEIQTHAWSHKCKHASTQCKAFMNLKIPQVHLCDPQKHKHEYGPRKIKHIMSAYETLYISYPPFVSTEHKVAISQFTGA